MVKLKIKVNDNNDEHIVYSMRYWMCNEYAVSQCQVWGKYVQQYIAILNKHCVVKNLIWSCVNYLNYCS